MTPERAPGKTELRARFRRDIGDYVVAAEVSPDGQLFVIGSGDGDLVAFEADTGDERFRVRAHAGGVLGVSFAPSSKRFVTCGQDEAARLWSESGELLRELPGAASAWVEHVAWAPAGGRIATGSGRRVRIWNEDGEPIVETEPLASTVSALAWRADGTAVAAACYGGVHVLPFVEGAKTRHLEWKGSLISLAVSPNGKLIACGSQDCSVHFWRLATGEDSEMRGYPLKPKALAWDRESKLLATGGDRTVTVWDFRGKGPEGTRPIQLESHRAACTALAFSPSSGILASGSEDTGIILWEPRRGERPLRHAFLEDAVTALAWRPNREELLAADAAGNIVLWSTG